MKTIKITFFSFLVLFIGTSLITSCSKEDDTNKSMGENAKVTSYLKSFYSKKIELGKSIESRIKSQASVNAKTTEYEDILITEVFVGDDTRARGYVITSKETNTFMYFVDVDRIDYKLTMVEIEANNTEVFKNIEELDKYASTNEFDFIKVTQDLIDQNIKEGTLSRIRYSYGACGGGFRGVYKAKYFLGIRVSKWEPVQDENGHNVTVGCDEKYEKDLSVD